MNRLAIYLFGPLIAAGLFTVGCGDDTKPTLDTSVDVVTGVDIAPDVIADTTPPEDAAPDDTAEVAEDLTTPQDSVADLSADTVEPETWPWPLAPTNVPSDASWRERFAFPYDDFAVVSWSENPLPSWQIGRASCRERV